MSPDLISAEEREKVNKIARRRNLGFQESGKWSFSALLCRMIQDIYQVGADYKSLRERAHAEFQVDLETVRRRKDRTVVLSPHLVEPKVVASPDHEISWVNYLAGRQHQSFKSR